MKFKHLVVMLVISAFAAVSIPSGLIAQKTSYSPDKELCARMIAAGKEYYERGRYLDAKNFFRKAVEADPQSQKAWFYYDRTVIFALAEKVEKKNDLLYPDTSIRGVSGSQGQHPAIAAPPVGAVQPQPTQGVPMAAPEEEGC
jgi:hypothetical protein